MHLPALLNKQLSKKNIIILFQAFRSFKTYRKKYNHLVISVSNIMLCKIAIIFLKLLFY